MELFEIKLPQWFLSALSNPRITDICLNGSHSAYIDQGLGLELLDTHLEGGFRDEQLKDWVIEALSKIGKTWDAKHPFIDATLPTGHRLHVVFPPLSAAGIIVSLRRLARSHLREGHSTPPMKEEKRWQNSPLFVPLLAAVKKGESVLISGSTGSGKTTLVSDLLEAAPAHERIIALEDTAELAPAHPHFLSLVTRPPNSDGFGEVTLRTLLKQTLRMRPDRIILGECRGNEVLDLLQALNTGHRGALATLHANSPRDALRRIELLCLLASSGTIPLSGIRELLSLGIQWVAQVKRISLEESLGEESLGSFHSNLANLANLPKLPKLPKLTESEKPPSLDLTRKITELWKIEGREGDTILMRQVLT